MIKFNEAISIKKSYDIILKKLKEERIVYDKQLESMETQLKTKKKEFDEMLLLSHDANHAKEMVENDLQNYTKKIEEMRTNRIKDIQE